MKPIHWHPPQCSCILEELQDGQTITPNRIIRACPTHAGITDPVVLWNLVLAEDRLKEKVRKAIYDNLPEIKSLITELRDGEETALNDWWTFDIDRRFAINIKNLKTKDKTQLQNLINQIPEFLGKVIING